MSTNHKRICIDFDGVIHRYGKGWGDGTAYDEPMEGALYAMKKLADQGYELVIFSTRPAAQIMEWLHKWWPEGNGEFPLVTNEKLPAIAYIDDRAIRFTNWSDISRYFL